MTTHGVSDAWPDQDTVTRALIRVDHTSAYTDTWDELTVGTHGVSDAYPSPESVRMVLSAAAQKALGRIASDDATTAAQ